jgi:hypothetical protein
VLGEVVSCPHDRRPGDIENFRDLGAALTQPQPRDDVEAYGRVGVCGAPTDAYKLPS